MKTKSTFLFLLIITMISCGGGGGGGYGGSSSGGTTPQPEQDLQVFRAELVTENSSVSSATGSAEVRIQNDEIQVAVTFNNGPQGEHAQHIHNGPRCPNANDDVDRDGLISANEALAAYGSIIVMLDSNLATSGGSFPSGPNYSYNQTASFSQLLGNINVSTLNLEGRAVNIHGAGASGSGLPVACGVLRRVQ